MKLSAVFGFCIVVAASPALAWNEPDSVLGVRWGASRTDAQKIIVKRWQDYGGPASMRDVYTSETFRPTCKDADLCFAPVLHVGPVEVLARWWFRDAKFTRADLNFNPKSYQDLRQLFVERYGSPSATGGEKLKTKMGVEVENEKLTWSGEKVYILLEKYCCDSIQTAKATFMLQSEVAREVDARRRKMEKGKKDL